MSAGEWIVDVTSFQKIFGLCGLKGVTLVDNGQGRTTEREDRARILETEFTKPRKEVLAS